MYRFCCILIILFGVNSGLKAQFDLLNKPFVDDLRFNKILSGNFLDLNLKISDIQGTPYLSENFEAGKIVTQEDSVFANISLRYNAYSDDLEFKQGENIFAVADKSIVKKAEFGGNLFSYRSFEVGAINRDGFFKILSEGKATLMVRYTIKFQDQIEAKAFSDGQPARFEDVEKHFYISVEKAPAKLLTNKKSLFEILSNHKSEMETFISKNKLSIRDEEELIKIIDQYNSL